MVIGIDYTERHARRTLYTLLAVELAFLVASLVMFVAAPDVRWGPLAELLDVNRESSIPTWFSSTQLFVIGAALLLMARTARRDDGVPGTFAMSGLLFVALSLDEGAGVHERISNGARALGLDWLLFEGRFGAWVVVYAIFALGLLIVGTRRLRELVRAFPREMRVATAGLAVLVAGAVGLEVLSYFLVTGEHAGWYRVEVAVEEFFEMSGVSLVLYAVLLAARRGAAPAVPARERQRARAGAMSRS